MNKIRIVPTGVYGRLGFDVIASFMCAWTCYFIDHDSQSQHSKLGKVIYETCDDYNYDQELDCSTCCFIDDFGQVMIALNDTKSIRAMSDRVILDSIIAMFKRLCKTSSRMAWFDGDALHPSHYYPHNHKPRSKKFSRSVVGAVHSILSGKMSNDELKKIYPSDVVDALTLSLDICEVAAYQAYKNELKQLEEKHQLELSILIQAEDNERTVVTAAFHKKLDEIAENYDKDSKIIDAKYLAMENELQAKINQLLRK